MKNLIILLFFVSFAAQGQEHQVRFGDSIYRGKVKFANIEYEVVDTPYLDRAEDYFWSNAGYAGVVVSRGENFVRINPSPIGSAPDGRRWGTLWGDGLIPEDTSVRVNGRYYYVLESTDTRPLLNLIERAYPNSSGCFDSSCVRGLPAFESLEVWRFTDGVNLWGNN